MKLNPGTGKPGLWDIARNNWTLGPDLDPFFFMRLAKYVVENGTIMAQDMMRYANVISKRLLIHTMIMAKKTKYVSIVVVLSQCL